MSTFISEALHPINMSVDGDAATQPSAKGSVQQRQSSHDVALPPLAPSSPSSVSGALARNLCQSRESDVTKVAIPSPCATAHDTLSAEFVPVLTTPETTPELDAAIGSDAAPTLPYSPAEGSRRITPYFIPQEPNNGKSFAPCLVSSEESVVYDGEDAIFPHKTLSPIEEIGSSRGLKRKRTEDCQSEGSKSK